MIPPLPASADAEVRALIRERRKIAAIKLVREHTGLGLKEAKDQVDALERELRLADPGATGPSASGGLIVGAAVCILAILAWWWLTR
jgi:Ribosomal protein L7/L12 C-terminal domain